MCRKVVENIQQIKSNSEGSSPLRIPASAIRIMGLTLSKDAILFLFLSLSFIITNFCFLVITLVILMRVS